MLNIQVEVTPGEPIQDEDAQLAVEIMQRAVAANADRVVQRVKVRALWGLFRPSFAIRVRHFRPFLRWLAENAGVQLDPPEVVE